MLVVRMRVVPTAPALRYLKGQQLTEGDSNAWTNSQDRVCLSSPLPPHTIRRRRWECVLSSHMPVGCMGERPVADSCGGESADDPGGQQRAAGFSPSDSVRSVVSNRCT